MSVAMWCRSALTCSASSGRVGATQQVDARVVMDDQGAQQVSIDGRSGHRVHDGIPVVAHIQEHPVITELEVRVHQDDAAVHLALEGDGGVDGQGRGPHTALGAVERDHLAHGPGRRAGRCRGRGRWCRCLGGTCRGCRDGREPDEQPTDACHESPRDGPAGPDSHRRQRGAPRTLAAASSGPSITTGTWLRPGSART